MRKRQEKRPASQEQKKNEPEPVVEEIEPKKILTLKEKVKDFFGFGESEEPLELPASFKKFARETRPLRNWGLLLHLTYAVFFLYPMLNYLTDVYRAPFPVYSQNRTIEVPVRIVLAVTDESMTGKMHLVRDNLEATLSQREVTLPLAISWVTEFIGVRTLESLETEKLKNIDVDMFEIRIALVHQKHWTDFSATHVKLGKKRWCLVQWYEKEEDVKRAESRLAELVGDVLVDLSHLDSIVKRDLREKMAAWQIATLPLSAQKRLVWDSAPIAAEYHIQVIHLHDAADSQTNEALEAQKTTGKALQVFAKMVEDVAEIKVTTEHLWDFDTSSEFLQTDVQDRTVLTHQKMELLVKKVDAETPATLEKGTIFRFVVIEKEPVIVLDQTEEDTKGLAVAAWGAILTRGEKTESMAISAMRILLGMDAELTTNWNRPPVAVCEWELARARLRVAVDSAMKAATAINSLHSLAEKVTNIVINDDVAAKATKAVRLLEKGVRPGNLPNLKMVKEARYLAESASTDETLLGRLYFPKDQRVAVLLPILLPCFVPVAKTTFSFIWKLLTNDWL